MLLGDQQALKVRIEQAVEMRVPLGVEIECPRRAVQLRPIECGVLGVADEQRFDVGGDRGLHH
ncbi:hypothetical protein [Chitinolyticbacter albus]|uniref:hypothetical protein n=1 Tax=Chitinolyticbacter albus TaxID=2961951 RepID=UPI00210D4C5D|nr:hypothetical protein [Chitinolyticbacter albus]